MRGTALQKYSKPRIVLNYLSCCTLLQECIVSHAAWFSASLIIFLLLLPFILRQRFGEHEFDETLVGNILLRTNGLELIE